ncbi:unnamed protein product [Musa textilis]
MDAATSCGRQPPGTVKHFSTSLENLVPLNCLSEARSPSPAQLSGWGVLAFGGLPPMGAADATGLAMSSVLYCLAGWWRENREEETFGWWIGRRFFSWASPPHSPKEPCQQKGKSAKRTTITKTYEEIKPKRRYPSGRG